MSELVIHGTDCHFDLGVFLGYRTGRKIQLQPTRIGNGAYVRTGTVIYTNTVIGSGLETGHNVVIREENVIGDHFSVWNNSCVDYGCVIGNDVKIHNNVYIAQFTTIEDDVFLAPGVVVANDPHPICTKCMKGPTLKRGSRIGVNATLLPHITIGEGALIGGAALLLTTSRLTRWLTGARLRPKNTSTNSTAHSTSLSLTSRAKTSKRESGKARW